MFVSLYIQRTCYKGVKFCTYRSIAKGVDTCQDDGAEARKSNENRGSNRLLGCETVQRSTVMHTTLCYKNM